MIRLGTDIEVFLTDKKNNPKNAFGIVKGTKQIPYEYEEGYFTSLDCVLMEYNTPPRDFKEDFKEDIKKSINYLKSLLNEDEQLSFFPAYEFTEDELFTIESKIFGCSPDFNAWKNGEQNIIANSESTNWRSAGLHLHIDIGQDMGIALVKNLDLCLAIPALILEPENRRKELYGKAGAFRYTPYGIEYRVLSSWFQQEEYLDFIWDNAELAFKLTKQGFVADNFVETIINSKDIKEAKKLIKEFKLLENYEIKQN